MSRWGVKEMERRIGRVVGSKNMWVTPWLLNSKHRELRNAGVSKKGRYDLTLGDVHIILQEYWLCSHRVEEGLQGRAVIMLATLGRV